MLQKGRRAGAYWTRPSRRAFGAPQDEAGGWRNPARAMLSLAGSRFGCAIGQGAEAGEAQEQHRQKRTSRRRSTMPHEGRRADFFAPDLRTIVARGCGDCPMADDIEHQVRQKGERMRKEGFGGSADSIVHVPRGKLNARTYHTTFLTFGVALGLSVCGSASAQECLTTPQQLLEKKVSNTWKELHQKDNQPLNLTINAGQGNQLQFVGRKPDGSTWISGALSICASAGNKYQVKLDRIDRAPFLVGHQLTGMSGTIPAGGSHLKFGTGTHCGNPDPCIEFAAE
jgi:hypothetical protein